MEVVQRGGPDSKGFCNGESSQESHKNLTRGRLATRKSKKKLGGVKSYRNFW